MKTLKEVRNYLDSIPFINSGGCLFSAYAMYLWLEKNNKLTKNTSVVLHYREWDDYTFNINNNVLNNQISLDNAESCAHAELFYRKRFTSSDRVTKIPKEYYAKQIYTINKEFILYSLKKEYNWNDLFDRKYIKQIEQKLEITLT